MSDPSPEARATPGARVLVTGATGFIGSHLCRALLGGGARVTALRRQRSSRHALEGLAVEEAEGDVTDAAALAAAVAGHDAVIHAAALTGLREPDPAAQERVNVGGTAAVAAACLRHGARLVHVSSVAAIGIPEGPHPADESFGFNVPPGRFPYHHSKHRAEGAVREALARGLDAVIVNPAWVLGRFGDSYRGRELLGRVRGRRLVPCFRGGVCVVHVDDVVDGILRALAHGKTGERYILGGENLTWRTLLGTVARELGAAPLLLTLPPAVTWPLAALGEGLGTLAGRRAPLTREMHQYVQRFHYYDSGRAARDLGFEARPWARIVADYRRATAAARP